MYVFVPLYPVPVEAREGPDRCSETGVTDPCELGTEPSPLQEQQVILIMTIKPQEGYFLVFKTKF